MLLHLNLQGSGLILLAQALVLVAIWSLFFITIPITLAILAIAISMIVIYMLKSRHSIVQLAEMSERNWHLYTTQHELLHAELQKVTGFACFIFMQFLAVEKNKMIHVCIAKDQVNITEWRKLQQLKRLI